MSTFVSSVFGNREEAELAVDRLIANGCDRSDISILMSDGTRGRDFHMEQNTKAPEGAATGGVIGGTLGALVAGLVGVGTVATGGAGIVAAGPIVAALAGGGAGAATGGLIGGLIGAGMPEHEAKVNSERLEKGDILVGVDAHDDRVSKIEDILSNAGGTGIKTD
ncbi:MAG: hypothetical protein HKP27_04745 [Myxococcales bacterium]|nr:hypothetical protein [Myxococcales bacterium]